MVAGPWPASSAPLEEGGGYDSEQLTTQMRQYATAPLSALTTDPTEFSNCDSSQNPTSTKETPLGMECDKPFPCSREVARQLAMRLSRTANANLFLERKLQLDGHPHRYWFKALAVVSSDDDGAEARSAMARSAGIMDSRELRRTSFVTLEANTTEERPLRRAGVRDLGTSSTCSIEDTSPAAPVWVRMHFLTAPCPTMPSSCLSPPGMSY
jgi:hypothetical protein